ncbi:MAG: CHAT domain-containing protein [Candidatus Thiothrix putei]|uniref:CHAT domain-containing protein n=1 Tax=Candidatus Thiothrix putei TaxID=3080811 RepID=A0AA95HE19_9GAMM|nr:MAG: CHAT domain-containing protein [Candidatus Thiothrix putei]
MSDTADKHSLQLLLPGVPGASTNLAKTPPAILSDISRSATGIPDPFISEAVVKVTAVHELLAPNRSGEAGKISTTAEATQLLALEATDGTTLFIRADKLQADLQRLYPTEYATGVLDLSKLPDPEGTSRGLSDWVWSKLAVLNLAPDALIETAKAEALRLAKDALGEKLSQHLSEDLEDNLSWVGAKALMWAIESRLDGGQPGLYRWQGQAILAADRVMADDPAYWEANRQSADTPILLFIHGTASSTLGSFKELANNAGHKLWGNLQRQFGEHIYGFEHRTFSESPIENALQLARSLPQGARLSVVTHSRGGLVGDLLCMDTLNKELILRYQRHPPANTKETRQQKALRESLNALQQAQLRELSALLQTKQFRIERYVRVACPAGGTTLLSDNLELFLSSLLSLMNLLVGSFTGGLGNAMLSAFKRIVLEIASKRIDPHVIPGIEAMLTDAPMGALLANAPRLKGVKMAVIAGDIAGGNALKRIAVMFTDWMFFNKVRNDLVVDTHSMYAGQARHPDTYALFDQGQEVSHFSYFSNPYTRQALDEWLAGNAPEHTAFEPLTDVAKQERQERSATTRLSAPSGKRPVVIYVPGIMGSHLEIPTAAHQRPGHGNRVWLDVLELGIGGLGRIHIEQSVVPEALVDLFYGKLSAFLGETYDVIEFPYDWRNPVEEAAERLAQRLRGILAFVPPDQPVHLLAHSMGGLVVRAMLAQTNLWAEVVKRQGRFIMLGTPNNGSHAMVSTLVGRASSIRKLAMLDMSRSLQGILDVIGAFPGALQLLPRPGFSDTDGATGFDYFTPDTWATFKKHNRDRWFGDTTGAIPGSTTLATAHAVWAKLKPLPNPEHIAYVFGKAEQTDCGIKLENSRLYLRSTAQGDGSVTWKSGKLEWLPEDRYWYMPVNHGALTHTSQYFPAIRELLETGTTTKLEQTPPVSRGDDIIRSYEAAPEPYPSAETFVYSIYSDAPEYPLANRKAHRLTVSVQAMDLRFAQLPVMCGHYWADAISGAERAVDEYIVKGALSQRQRLGVYADTEGSSIVILNKRTQEELQRGTGKGAVIIGLGDWSKISTQRITEGVADGVLNFLLQQHELITGLEETLPPAALSLGLNSLLIGYNSTTHITVESSIDAIVRGVCEANQRFARNTTSQLRVGKLEFIELYRDTAITAAYAVRELPKRLTKEFQRYAVQVSAAPHMLICKGVRPRLGVMAASGYWPRLMVTAANSLPPDDYKAGETPDAFKYVFLSERARAEEIAYQRQPRLIETLVESSLWNNRYNAEAARTLFQLMVPLHFKAMARQTERLLLVVDAYTANLPWEMLLADDEPLVLQVAMIRQLVSVRFRRTVTSTVQRTACVIGNPATTGYQGAFNPQHPEPEAGLLSLPGAAQEANTIHTILQQAPEHYEVVALYPQKHSDAPHHTAEMVFNALFKQPYRILTIAAHGVVNAKHKDGKYRTGVVLSGGLLLTAAEIGQMEVVPELVFLNCCHLATTNGEPVRTDVPYNHLAYSLAQELIEMGVRCVVAAGWAVDDAAAAVFAKTFFSAFVQEQQTFGAAVHNARRATWTHDKHCNTWGAYQAYGDPSYVLDADGSQPEVKTAWNPVAPDELLAELETLQTDANHRKHRTFATTYHKVQGLLQRSPAEWLQLSRIQFALGELYAEYAPEGFEQAQAAYRQAISGDDGGRVPVKAVEQLANLEARTGEKIGGEAGHSLLNNAINRLTGLLEVTEGIQVETVDGIKHVISQGVTDTKPNAERWSLLGSAWKRKAVLYKRAETTTHPLTEAIKEALNHSRRAYHAANRNVTLENPAFNLYALLNGLQLDALLTTDAQQPEAVLALQHARRCQELARQRFARSYDFFDAVIPVDAQLAIYLLENTLADQPVKALVKLYQDAAAPVPTSSRQFDSVVRQLQLIADFLPLQQRDNGDRCVQTLRDVAERLAQQAE